MPFNKISMIQINYFLAVARHLNFTQAAKNLYVSQPSLSKQIAMLENELGVQLFSRTKRSVELTPAGKILFSELSDIRDRLEVAFEKSRQAGPEGMDTVRIGCLDAMNTELFLPAMIDQIKDQYPGTVIVLERHSFQALKEKLLNRALDVIFTLSFEMDDSLEIESDVVYHSSCSIYMASSHPLAKRNHVTIKDLKSENFVLIDRDVSPNGFDRAVEFCVKNGFHPKIVKQAPNIESLLLCIRAGLGVALLDSNLRLYNKDKYKLFEIKDDILGIVMAWKKDNQDEIIQFFAGPLLKKIKSQMPEIISAPAE